MSEAIGGLPAPPEVAVPRPSASVVLMRPAAGGVEVFLVRRDSRLRFAAGFYAFPGGAVDYEDGRVPVGGVEGSGSIFPATAARELFEETGVLCVEGGEAPEPIERDVWRQALLEGKEGFGEGLSKRGLRVREEDFLPAGRWVTPPFMPVRFEAQFFLVEASPGAKAEVWSGELSEGAWVRPEDALQRWADGQMLLHPPALHALRTLAGFTSAADAAARMEEPPHAPGDVATRIEFQRGILLFPLRTPTLPPATHTNAYVLGNGEALLVDPGATDAGEQARFASFLAELQAEGRRLSAVVLTHHHQDHVGAAAAVAERFGLPVWCHAKTAERLGFAAARRLFDGEVLEVAGEPPMRFRVLHTPGHAPGHLCLVDEKSRAAVVGDMVAGIGTIVIDPTDGDMAEYVAQLTRLARLPVGTLYPAHGPVMPDGPGKLAEYVAHRAARERLVLEAVSASGATLVEVVAAAYADTPIAMHPIAELSAAAILAKLAAEAKVARREGRYYPCR